MEAWLEQNQLSEIQSQIQEWGVEGLDELEFVEGAPAPVCQVHCWQQQPSPLARRQHIACEMADEKEICKARPTFSAVVARCSCAANTPLSFSAAATSLSTVGGCGLPLSWLLLLTAAGCARLRV